MTLRKFVPLALGLILAATTNAQSYVPQEDDMAEASIFGSIQGDSYYAPSGAYSIHIPVLAELGGQIDDNEYAVTFQDVFGSHLSIICVPMDEKLREEETKRGRKEFLAWFFSTQIQTDFQRSIPGASVEPNARYISGVQGGALLTSILLPDASLFAERVFIFPPNPAPVAKRGNLVFINNNNVYVVSSELSERIFEYSTYNKTPAEEEEILRKRLLDVVAHMVFAPGTASAASGTNGALPGVSFPASGK